MKTKSEICEMCGITIGKLNRLLYNPPFEIEATKVFNGRGMPKTMFNDDTVEKIKAHFEGREQSKTVYQVNARWFGRFYFRVPEYMTIDHDGVISKQLRGYAKFIHLVPFTSAMLNEIDIKTMETLVKGMVGKEERYINNDFLNNHKNEYYLAKMVADNVKIEMEKRGHLEFEFVEFELKPKGE